MRLSIGIAAVAAVVVTACAERTQPEQTATPSSPVGTAAAPAVPEAPSGAQEFTVDVRPEGFVPASLTAQPGQPIRIHFKRDDQPSCGDEVIFPALDIRRALPPNQTTTVDLPPQEAKTLNFACGMDMYKGTIVVQ